MVTFLAVCILVAVARGKDEAEDVSITHHKPQDKTEKVCSVKDVGDTYLALCLIYTACTT